MPLALALTPQGTLVIEDSEDSFPALDPAATERVARAFAAGTPAGLIHLATAGLDTRLPASFSYWRDFAKQYVTRLCHTPPAEGGAEIQVSRPSPDEFASMLESAPPMTGIEYLRAELLARLWDGLDEAVRHEIARFPGGAQAWLRASNPIWNMVGRVTFHLAENRRDPDYPFAFMATYTSSVTTRGRLQYLPLGKALQEYAGAQNRNALVSLLSPVQRAASRSEFVRGIVESGDLFHALGWTPEQAYRLLAEVPLLETSGVLVRVPGSWRSGRPPRPVVSVKIGSNAVNKLGADALLDFSARLTLDGEPISQEEWDAIAAASDGLVLLKGKWVEIDRAKLSEILGHWDRLTAAHQDGGIPFAEGMRLLAGAGLAREEESLASKEAREWCRVAPGEWLEAVLRELRDPAAATAEIDSDLRTDLRGYQRVGASWLWFMFRMGLGACLADDMGLGKTVQLLALLLAIKRRHAGAGGTASLVVAPASLVANWKAEIARFAPTLSTLFAHPSEAPAVLLRELEGNSAAALAGVDLVVTSYGMLLRAPWFAEVNWSVVVLDEAQAIKNPSARQTRAAKKLKAAHRIALTGTPVENRLGDLWSLFDFLSPGLLGSIPEFKRFVKTASGEDGRTPFAAIRNLVRPYILRRLKTDRNVIADLPDKTEVRAFCPLSRKQAALYEQSVRELSERLRESEGIQRRGLVLAFIQRFKQICNHPSHWLGAEDYEPEVSGKFQRLRALCEVMAARQQKVLVFTQFREIAAPLSEFLHQVFRRPGLVLHGGTPVRERRALIDQFQSDDGPPYFVLSLKAGGTGLNLTAASHVVHFDRWWNPAVEDQATDRAYRIGQHKNVLVHKFVCRGTIEDRIDALIEEKKGMAAEILSEGAEKLLTEMSDEQLLSFVALDVRSAVTD